MKTYRELTVNQKINFKALLLKCGFKTLNSVVKYSLPIHPINPIFDK
jgi:hypothetical protein